ncbi:GPP34 family phosphoprotein [Homoserinimonas sp. A520]
MMNPVDRDRLTLAEEVLLSEPATDGRMVYGGFTIGAAALVELAVRGIVVMGRVRLWGQRLTLVDDAPVGIESLDVAINVLAGRQRPWTARAAIWKVSEPVSASAVMELNRRGIVRARGLPMRHGGWLELLDFELRHRTLAENRPHSTAAGIDTGMVRDIHRRSGRQLVGEGPDAWKLELLGQYPTESLPAVTLVLSSLNALTAPAY